MKRAFKFGAAAVAVVLLAGIVGAEDYSDTVREAVRYCENVKAGIWPDYDDTAKHCPEVMAEAERVLGGAK